METAFQREVEALIRDLERGRVPYDAALERYRRLSDHITWEARGRLTGDSTDEAMRGLLSRVQSTIQRLYGRVIAVVSIEAVGQPPSGWMLLEAHMQQDTYVAWLEGLVAGHRHQLLIHQWAGRRCTVFFDGVESAVAFGNAVLNAVPELSACAGSAQPPHQIRIGVHAGVMLPSDGPDRFGIGDGTVETAHLLQEAAQPNQMVVSPAACAFLEG
jgi:hypothetical protein